jgi:hypothetical protein
MQSNRKTALVLASLVCANLGADFALSQSEGLFGYLFLVAIGVPLSQIILLAAWLSFGDGRWYWRLATAVVLAGLVGVACHLPSIMVGEAFLPLVLIFLMFVLLAGFLPLRQLRGWRLTRSAITGSTYRARFQIRHLILWTLAVSMPLALARVLREPFSGGVSAGLASVAIVGLLLAILLVTVMLVALAPNAGRPSVSFAGLILFYGATATAAGTFLFYRLLIIQLGPPGWIALLQSVALAASAFLFVPLVLYANCRVLRALGWRLVRPVRRPIALNEPPGVV